MTQPTNFNDWSLALRMRDAVTKLVREEMNRQRPPARYAKVVSFNRFSLNAKVLFPGDTETTTVKFPLSLQPTRSVDLFGDQAADIVRVEGVPGNLWITEAVNGPTQNDQSRLSSPKLVGGAFLHEQRASWSSAGTGPLPAEGEAWYVGRWTNETSFGADGLTSIDVVVQQAVLCSVVKRYSVAVKSNDTAGVWSKVVPSQDSGPWSGNDFELEMKTSSNSIEFRIRRTGWNTGFTPGGYDFDIWFYGKEWEKDVTVPDSLTSGAAPPFVAGTASVDEGKGPFVSPGLHAPQLAQHLVMGGGAVSYSATLGQLKWTSRFIIIGLGNHHLLPSGFFDIPVPLGGMTIPVYSWSGGSTTQTVAGGIYLANWQALYYEIPWGDDFTGLEENFRIVSWEATGTTPFQIPSHWVLLAVKGGDSAFPCVKLASGEIIHSPVALTLGPASVVPWGGSFATPGYRRIQGGRVSLEGLAKATAAVAVGSTIATLPTHFKPASTYVFNVRMETASGRIDVLANGTIVTQTAIPLNNFVSLDGITFPVVQ